MLKRIFKKMFSDAISLNKKNILDFLEENKDAKVLDLGCDDGLWTLELAKKIGSTNIYGVDVIDKRLEIAKKSGIVTKNSDLNSIFPFEDNFFDVIHTNQVIEHIVYLDDFISEVYRILKPGGYVVVSTENGSSWHNIFAAILGWQTFSSAIMSTKAIGVGNPLSINRSISREGTSAYLKAWTHKVIFNYRGLKEFFAIYGFKGISVEGAGYYPLPAVFGKIDARHSHFITLKAYKK